MSKTILPEEYHELVGEGNTASKAKNLLLRKRQDGLFARALDSDGDHDVQDLAKTAQSWSIAMNGLKKFETIIRGENTFSNIQLNERQETEIFLRTADYLAGKKFENVIFSEQEQQMAIAIVAKFSKPERWKQLNKDTAVNLMRWVHGELESKDVDPVKAVGLIRDGHLGNPEAFDTYLKVAQVSKPLSFEKTEQLIKLYSAYEAKNKTPKSAFNDGRLINHLVNLTNQLAYRSLKTTENLEHYGEHISYRVNKIINTFENYDFSRINIESKAKVAENIVKLSQYIKKSRAKIVIPKAFADLTLVANGVVKQSMSGNGFEFKNTLKEVGEKAVNKIMSMFDPLHDLNYTENKVEESKPNIPTNVKVKGQNEVHINKPKTSSFSI
jgi:hypothetical protein